jgi:hypothetical protein
MVSPLRHGMDGSFLEAKRGLQTSQDLDLTHRPVTLNNGLRYQVGLNAGDARQLGVFRPHEACAHACFDSAVKTAFSE